MKKFSQYEDINAVISVAQNLLVSIEKQYNESLNQKEIPNSLCVSIKIFLENLRSSKDRITGNTHNSSSRWHDKLAELVC